MNDEYRNPNPTCENECRFVFDPERVKIQAVFPPEYDKHGNNLNPDVGPVQGTVKCYTCNKTWSYTRKYGEPTVFVGVTE